MTRAALVVFLLLPASVVSGQVSGHRVRAEGVAAFIGVAASGSGTVVVLRSDVELRARMRLAARSDRLPTGPLPEPLLAAALEEIIGEVLIAREADRLRAARPRDADVARERARLEELASVSRYLGVEANEIDEIARRRAYVEAFLVANIEGAGDLSDAQLRRAYDAGGHPFAGRPLEDVREVLRAWLDQRRLQRDVARWIEVLRSRTEVRVLAEWRGGG